MPLKGDAKREYDRQHKRVARQATRPHRYLSALDMDVLRLAAGDWTVPELAESLGISAAAAFKALERVAAYLAPTPAAKLSINPADCLPFVDEAYA